MGKCEHAESLSTRLLSTILVTHWGREYLSKRLYSLLDVSNLFPIGGRLLRKQSVIDKTRHLRKAHIVVLYEDCEGANNRFERQIHIRGHIGDLDGQPRHSVGLPPTRLFG